MAKDGKYGIEFDGTEVLPESNLEVGMDFDLWNHDRGGFRTTRRMVTGGMATDFGCYAGPEVGGQYNGAMGEDRAEVTFIDAGDNAMHTPTEHPGALPLDRSPNPGGFGSPRPSQFASKKTLAGPQNYRLYSKGQRRGVAKYYRYR
jgi:hypothetical protein